MAGRLDSSLRFIDVKLSVSRSPRLYSRLLFVRRTDQQHRFVWAAPDNPSPGPPRGGRPITEVVRRAQSRSSRWIILPSQLDVGKLRRHPPFIHLSSRVFGSKGRQPGEAAAPGTCRVTVTVTRTVLSALAGPKMLVSRFGQQHLLRPQRRSTT